VTDSSAVRLYVYRECGIRVVRARSVALRCVRASRCSAALRPGSLRHSLVILPICVRGCLRAHLRLLWMFALVPRHSLSRALACRLVAALIRPVLLNLATCHGFTVPSTCLRAVAYTQPRAQVRSPLRAGHLQRH
jgi:hypothetical protein